MFIYDWVWLESNNVILEHAQICTKEKSSKIASKKLKLYIQKCLHKNNTRLQFQNLPSAKNIYCPIFYTQIMFLVHGKAKNSQKMGGNLFRPGRL